jgi:hypothetical protein
MTESLQDDLLMLPKNFGCRQVGDGWLFLLESCSDLIFWTPTKERKSARSKVVNVADF